MQNGYQVRRSAIAIGAMLLFPFAVSPAVGLPPEPSRAERNDAGRLRDVLQSYARWRGDARFAALRGFRARGTITTAGGSGPTERWVAPKRMRTDEDSGAGRSTRRVGPAGAWKTAFSGQVEALSLAERGDALRDAGLLLPLSPARSTRELALKDAEVIGGRSRAVVSVREATGDGADYLIDPDGALYGIRVYRDGRSRLVAYSDWRMVDGVRMPFRETVEDDGERTDIVYDRIEIDPRVRDTVFTKPRSQVTLSFGRDGTSGWLGFEFFDEERIFVDATVNGRQVQMLLDSGAEASVLDQAYLMTTGLAARSEIGATGLNAAATAGVVPGVSIGLGEARIAGLTVAAIDLQTVSAQMRHPLPAILGAEVFRDAVVDIDFSNRRIAFRDPARFIPPVGAVGAAVTPADGQYMIDAVVNGRPARLDFDLGSGSPLILWEGFWNRIGLAAPRSTTVIGGVGGLGEAGIARVPGVAIGGTALPEVPTVLMPKASKGIARTRSDGNVGVPILRRFRLIVDLPHGRVWFIPGPAAESRFARDRSGLATTLVGGRLRILHVAAGSPADRAGLKPGESIAAVDGRAADALPDRRWGQGEAGTTRRLTMDEGRIVTLLLADYF